MDARVEPGHDEGEAYAACLCRACSALYSVSSSPSAFATLGRFLQASDVGLGSPGSHRARAASPRSS